MNAPLSNVAAANAQPETCRSARRLGRMPVSQESTSDQHIPERVDDDAPPPVPSSTNQSVLNIPAPPLNSQCRQHQEAATALSTVQEIQEEERPSASNDPGKQLLVFESRTT